MFGFVKYQRTSLPRKHLWNQLVALQHERVVIKTHLKTHFCVLYTGELCADLIVVNDAVGASVIVDTLSEVPSIPTS